MVQSIRIALHEMDLWTMAYIELFKYQFSFNHDEIVCHNLIFLLLQILIFHYQVYDNWILQFSNWNHPSIQLHPIFTQLNICFPIYQYIYNFFLLLLALYDDDFLSQIIQFFSLFPSITLSYVLYFLHELQDDSLKTKSS